MAKREPYEINNVNSDNVKYLKWDGISTLEVKFRSDIDCLYTYSVVSSAFARELKRFHDKRQGAKKQEDNWVKYSVGKSLHQNIVKDNTDYTRKGCEGKRKPEVKKNANN